MRSEPEPAGVVERDVTGREVSGNGRMARPLLPPPPNTDEGDLQVEADKCVRGALDVVVCKVLLVKNHDAVVLPIQTSAPAGWNVWSSSLSGMCLSSF